MRAVHAIESGIHSIECLSYLAIKSEVTCGSRVAYTRRDNRVIFLRKSLYSMEQNRVSVRINKYDVTGNDMLLGCR